MPENDLLTCTINALAMQEPETITAEYVRNLEALLGLADEWVKNHRLTGDQPGDVRYLLRKLQGTDTTRHVFNGDDPQPGDQIPKNGEAANEWALRNRRVQARNHKERTRTELEAMQANQKQAGQNA